MTSLTDPSDVSPGEFQDLLSQIRADFTLEECRDELMEAARYDDVDVVRALLHCHPKLVDAVEESSGNTAWHMAAGNGHTRVLELLQLVSTASSNATNKAGNTPLHWATTNGHQAAVQFLLKLPQVDVLQRNQFGRSILTEGFARQNTELVQVLLEHDSAAEERLVQSTESGPTESVTHELILSGIPVQIRELPMATSDKDRILGQADPNDDTTGFGLWAASMVLGQWLAKTDFAEASQILELGAGCGLPGLVLARKRPTAQVYVTDFNPKTVENLQHNIEINQTSNAQAQHMNWQDPNTWPKEPLDVVVGSDLIYQTDMALLLHQTLGGLLSRPHGRFYYVSPQTGRQGQEEFMQLMQRDFQVTQHTLDPSYLSNPRADQDDDLCFLHFNELQSTDFQLLEFSWR